MILWSKTSTETIIHQWSHFFEGTKQATYVGNTFGLSDSPGVCEECPGWWISASGRVVLGCIVPAIFDLSRNSLTLATFSWSTLGPMNSEGAVGLATISNSKGLEADSKDRFCLFCSGGITAGVLAIASFKPRIWSAIRLSFSPSSVDRLDDTSLDPFAWLLLVVESSWRPAGSPRPSPPLDTLAVADRTKQAHSPKDSFCWNPPGSLFSCLSDWLKDLCQMQLPKRFASYLAGGLCEKFWDQHSSQAFWPVLSCWSASSTYHRKIVS